MPPTDAQTDIHIIKTTKIKILSKNMLTWFESIYKMILALEQKKCSKTKTSLLTTASRKPLFQSKIKPKHENQLQKSNKKGKTSQSQSEVFFLFT